MFSPTQKMLCVRLCIFALLAASSVSGAEHSDAKRGGSRTPVTVSSWPWFVPENVRAAITERLEHKVKLQFLNGRAYQLVVTDAGFFRLIETELFIATKVQYFPTGRGFKPSVDWRILV